MKHAKNDPNAFKISKNNKEDRRTRRKNSRIRKV